MAVFKFDLKNTKGDHRYVSAGAPSEDEAEAFILQQEEDRLAYVIGDPAEIKELEKKLKAGRLRGRDKASLLTHRHSKPYKIIKAKGGTS